MKTLKPPMIHGLVFISALAISDAASAKNVSDLKLDCHGTYQVQSAKPYYQPAPTYPTRVIPQAYAGAHEQIKIISLGGKDCEKLKLFYKIDLQVGKVLALSEGTTPDTAEQAQDFAKAQVNKTFPFEVSQNFNYTLDNGDLPFFPLIHSESASVLGLYGDVDSKSYYGTPSLVDLDDTNKMKIANQLLEMEDYGIIYQNYIQYGDQWLPLLLSLDFKSMDMELEHLQNLILVLNNMVKKSSVFYSSTPSNLVAKKISSLLNQYGKSKWSTKLDILKMNPALLNSQLVIWSKPNEVLKLTSTEIEDYLSYALMQMQALKQVPQVYEAQVLKSQYKGSAEALKSSPIGQDKHFELSSKSEELIAVINSL